MASLFPGTLLIAAALLAVPEPAPDPASAYQRQTLEGFTLLIHPEVAKHPDELATLLKELGSQLKEIGRVVPAKQLAELRKVRFWIEWEKKKNGAAEYHVSAGWLKANGYNPDKAGDIEINNARNFVAWSRKAQPWMVLHELAHGYHHRVLGKNHAGIEAAYRQAMERKLYESVEYVGGGKRKAYACTNAKEYFAEISEAYFGKNDFAPYTRADLEKHDPAGYKVLREVWGEGGR